jgi:hypothetical protein
VAFIKTPVKILLTKLRAYQLNALPAHIVSQTPNPYVVLSTVKDSIREFLSCSSDEKGGCGNN